MHEQTYGLRIRFIIKTFILWTKYAAGLWVKVHLPYYRKTDSGLTKYLAKARSATSIKAITTSQRFLTIWRTAENRKFWTDGYPTWSERRSKCWFSYEMQIINQKQKSVQSIWLFFERIPKPLYWPGNQTYIFLIPGQNPCHPKHPLDPCNPKPGFAFTGR